jgi:hypothetical protein
MAASSGRPIGGYYLKIPENYFAVKYDSKKESLFSTIYIVNPILN